MNSSLEKLLKWERFTGDALNGVNVYENLNSAYELSIDLLHNNDIYLEYTNAFCLFHISSKNLAQYVSIHQCPECASHIIQNCSEYFHALLEREDLPEEYVVDIDRELDLLESELLSQLNISSNIH